MSASTDTGELVRRAAERARREVVEILQMLVRFDTTIETHDDPPRDELAFQEFVATFLRHLGADVELFEPDPAELSGHPQGLHGVSFAGRPILMARLAGAGGGRSLLLNGHLDTVPAGPVSAWQVDPWEGAVRDGRLIGRGACDMKGGLAVGLAVLHGLAAEGHRFDGDVLFNVVPFEEVSGLGTVVTVRRGHRADAAITLEPTELDQVVAMRGLVVAELSVAGRAAHAEIGQPHYSLGGGVNAVEKLVDLLVGVRRMNDEWRSRPDKQHDLLTTPQILVTMIEGGDFPYTYPATAKATLNIPYTPGDADADGLGSRVRNEVEHAIVGLSQADAWLRENPPRIRWITDLPPAAISPEQSLSVALREAARRQGVDSHRPKGSDGWSDQGTLIVEGKMPAVSFGPGSLDAAHAIDESVSIEQLNGAIDVLTDFVVSWTADPAARREP